MVSDRKREFDFIVFGASGFTGKYVVQFLAKFSQKHPKLRWAMGGRNEEKLKSLGLDAPIVIADVEKPESLKAMCLKTSVLINCVGPFYCFGVPVVKSCIENRCHYVDITGEPLFMEHVFLTLHDRAKKNETLVVPGCGFDSIPSDLGVSLMVENAQKRGVDLKSIDAFISLKGPFRAHLTTLESALHGFSQKNELKNIRNQLKKTRWNQRMSWKTFRRTKPFPFFDKRLGSWFSQFIGPDASVIRNTQRQKAARGEEGPHPRVSVYFNTHSFIRAWWGFFLAGLALILLGKFKAGKSLIFKYPKLFTAGLASKQGPSAQQLNRCSFTIDFFGDQGQHTQVEGPEPGYVATPILVVNAAYVILSQHSALLEQSGAHTPASVFPPKLLADELTNWGIHFRTN